MAHEALTQEELRQSPTGDWYVQVELHGGNPALYNDPLRRTDVQLSVAEHVIDPELVDIYTDVSEGGPCLRVAVPVLFCATPVEALEAAFEGVLLGFAAKNEQTSVSIGDARIAPLGRLGIRHYAETAWAGMAYVEASEISAAWNALRAREQSST